MGLKFRIFSGLSLGFVTGYNMPNQIYNDYWQNVQKERLKQKDQVDKKEIDKKDTGGMELHEAWCYVSPTLKSFYGIGQSLITFAQEKADSELK